MEQAFILALEKAVDALKKYAEQAAASVVKAETAAQVAKHYLDEIKSIIKGD